MMPRRIALTSRQREFLNTILADPRLDLHAAAKAVKVALTRVVLWMRHPAFCKELEATLALQRLVMEQRHAAAGLTDNLEGSESGETLAASARKRTGRNPPGPGTARLTTGPLTQEQYEGLVRRARAGD